MEQIMIYDFLGNNVDPVYDKLSKLKKGETVALEDMELSLNLFGLYEVSSETYHEGFSDIKKCYEFVCEILNLELLDGDRH